MSETFDHAKELVEKNPVAAAAAGAGALAAAGIALYLTRGEILSFFKPSVMEAGAELAETGAGRVGLESATTLGGNGVKELTVHGAPEITALSFGGPLDPADIPAWLKTAHRIDKVLPALVQDPPLSATVDWETLYSEMNLSKGAGFSPVAVEGWGPLLAEGHAPLVNAAEWAKMDELLGRNAAAVPISDVHWRLPNSAAAEVNAGLIKPVE